MWEVLLVAIGLSIDVFVVSAYMGAGFSKINKKKSVLPVSAVWRDAAFCHGSG